jgi:hypothetical protein
MIRYVRKTFYPSIDRSGRDMGIGWIERGAPDTYFPGSGMTVAHDLLEHKLHPKYGIEEELMAFGAMLFIRGQGGYFAQHGRKYTTWAENTCDELAEMLSNYRNAIAPCRSWRLDDYIEGEIGDVLHRTKRSLADEFPEAREVITDASFAHMVNWLRRGFRWAENRYRIGAANTCYLFMQVQQEVDRCNPNHEYGIRITVDLDHYDVDLVKFYDDPEIYNHLYS